MFAKIYGARRDRTSTYLDDDERAPELVERETHLADVRAWPGVRVATKCVAWGVRGDLFRRMFDRRFEALWTFAAYSKFT